MRTAASPTTTTRQERTIDCFKDFNLTMSKKSETKSLLEWLFGGVTNMDMMEQLASYGAYHSHPINQLIHVIFVPVLVFTFMVFVSYLSPVPVPEGMGNFVSSVMGNDGSSAPWSFFLFATYAMYYVALDANVGSGAALYLYALFRAVEPFKQWAVTSKYTMGEDAWKVALALHIFAWYMQIHPGHAVFEKRKPALLDSFAQSILMAPMFVLYEVLFFMGYDKEFKIKLDTRVEEKKRIAGVGNREQRKQR